MKAVGFFPLQGFTSGTFFENHSYPQNIYAFKKMISTVCFIALLCYENFFSTMATTNRFAGEADEQSKSKARDQKVIVTFPRVNESYWLVRVLVSRHFLLYRAKVGFL